MKLNKGKIHGIIHEKKKGLTMSEIAQDMKITPRRAQQIWKYYVATKIWGADACGGKKLYKTYVSHNRISMSAGHIDCHEWNGT